MGISASKRVRNTLTNSPHFNSICYSTFDHFLSISSGGSHILPYQLFDAATHLHVSLHNSLTLITRWAPSSPTRAQVDHAYRAQVQEIQFLAQEAQVREAHIRAQESLTQAQSQESPTEEGLDQAQKLKVQAQTKKSLAEEGLDQAQEGLGQDQAQEGMAQDQVKKGLAQECLDQVPKGLVQAQEGLGRDEFKEFAVVLFSDMIVSGAKAKVVGVVPVGVVGIGGVGLVSRVDKNLVASAIGVYALGVATWIYLGLA